MMELSLDDFPYTGERRPFDWYLAEPKAPSYAPLVAEQSTDPNSSLLLTMLVYMAERKKNYINYMARGKLVFMTLAEREGLKDKAPSWSKEVTEWLTIRVDRNKLYFIDWTPAYEIQRLWLATGIHWSWLELAWKEAELKIWNSGNSYMIKNLQRVPPKCLNS